MPSQRRRPFLQCLSTSTMALLGGCSLLATESSPDRPPESKTIRTLDPVPTEGDPYQISQNKIQAQGPEEVLRTGISNRSDCLLGEVPVKPYNSGLIVTTKSVITSVEHTNVDFPGQAYRHLKKITPRSINVTPADDTPTPLDSISVFIRAILRQGEEEDSIPEIANDC